MWSISRIFNIPITLFSFLCRPDEILGSPPPRILNHKSNTCALILSFWGSLYPLVGAFYPFWVHSMLLWAQFYNFFGLNSMLLVGYLVEAHVANWSHGAQIRRRTGGCARGELVSRFSNTPTDPYRAAQKHNNSLFVFDNVYYSLLRSHQRTMILGKPQKG